MKYYVQFTRTLGTQWNNSHNTFQSCKPYQQDILGSSGVFILDGRNNIKTMVKDSMYRKYNLQNIHSDITGFKIMKGDFKQATCVYEHLFNTAWND